MLIISLLMPLPVDAMSPKSALKELRKKYRAIKSLKVEFREVFEWELTGESNIRLGEMLVTDDNRFRVDTVDQLIVCDGNDIYRYNRQRNQVIIERVKDDDKLLPRKILLDFADGFKAMDVTEIAVDERQGFRLDLEAEDPEASLMSHAIIWATGDDMVVHRLKLIDLNSNSTTYYLSRIEFDLPVDQNEITFSPPEDAEIFDLR